MDRRRAGGDRGGLDQREAAAGDSLALVGGGALDFAGFFLRESVRGGWDVARRAISPGLALSPAIVCYSFHLPPGPSRLFFCSAISLLPGTAVVAIADSNYLRSRAGPLEFRGGRTAGIGVARGGIVWLRTDEREGVRRMTAFYPQRRPGPAAHHHPGSGSCLPPAGARGQPAGGAALWQHRRGAGAGARQRTGHGSRAGHRTGVRVAGRRAGRGVRVARLAGR